jgi:acyl-CoA thioester hydrolase
MARHVYRCPLRWSDMDAFGHVNNAVYFRYLEEARIDIFFRQGPEEDVEPFSKGVVVARHEIDYLRPLIHSYEPVTVETWVEKMSAGSVTLAYEIKDAERVYARARTVVVPYDLTEQRPRRLTPAEREFCDAYRDDGGGHGNPEGTNPDGGPDGERPREAVAA